jgi:hypothetical protein
MTTNRQVDLSTYRQVDTSYTVVVRMVKRWRVARPTSDTTWLGDSVQSELIGSSEAAQLLGKSSRTVHRLVESGVLVPAMTAPGGAAGVFLFRRTDVERLMPEEGDAA